jgi:hypothetical protein
MLNTEIRKKFLINTDETGRFIVCSKRTGVTYFVEPIGHGKTVWGDLDPATKQLTGNYGQKYRGSVKPEESLISEEVGFKEVVTLDKGVSPLMYIDWKDAKYPTKV